MRKLALLIAVMAAAGASGSLLSESCIVMAARQLTQACALGLARSIAPKDPVDFARRPPAIRVDDAGAALVVLAEGDAPPAPPRTRTETVADADVPVLRIPVSRDLGSVVAELERKRRSPCTVLAQGTSPRRPVVG